jgi:hypothetical protein
MLKSVDTCMVVVLASARPHSPGQSEARSPKLLTIATSTSDGQATSDDFTSLHSFPVPQRCDVRGSTAVDLPLSSFAIKRASDARYQQKPTRLL